MFRPSNRLVCNASHHVVVGIPGGKYSHSNRVTFSAVFIFGTTTTGSEPALPSVGFNASRYPFWDSGTSMTRAEETCLSASFFRGISNRIPAGNTVMVSPSSSSRFRIMKFEKHKQNSRNPQLPLSQTMEAAKNIPFFPGDLF